MLAQDDFDGMFAFVLAIMACSGHTSALGPAKSIARSLGLWFSPVLLLAGCATPVAPSGGPPDQTPPRLVASLPEAGALHVETDELRLAFSEDVNAGSVVRALTIVPSFSEPLDIDVNREEVRIRFPAALRDSTTYVVTLGTDLQDLRSVKLSAPITLAFSTGDQLDEGRITGTLRDPLRGQGVADVNVFAYALPPDFAATDSLPDPREAEPSYQTQTGADGRFAFEYLRPGPFFVAAVQDLNRSRTADPGEAFAVPAEVPVVASDSADVPDLALYLARRDTVGPELRSVRSASNRRFAVRFDESVLLASRATTAWSVTDTTTGSPATVETVYQTPDVPQQVWLVTDTRAARGHRVALVDPAAVTDSTGNGARGDAVFTPSVAPDTVQTRVAALVPTVAESDTVKALRPDERPGVRFTRAPDSAALALVQITPTDLILADTVADGVTLKITDLGGAERVALTVPRADSTRTVTFTVPTADDLGELVGVVARDSLVGDAPIVVELRLADELLQVTRANATGGFRFEGLPEGEYQLRLIADRDTSGTWTGGTLAPYAPPEALLLVPTPERVRPRWETVIDTLRFGTAPRSAQPSTPPTDVAPLGTDDG
ncbi:MAG: Ig-like domain-containing protein [Bacteroidota bacterium]